MTKYIYKVEIEAESLDYAYEEMHAMMTDWPDTPWALVVEIPGHDGSGKPFVANEARYDNSTADAPVILEWPFKGSMLRTHYYAHIHDQNDVCRKNRFGGPCE